MTRSGSRPFQSDPGRYCDAFRKVAELGTRCWPPIFVRNSRSTHSAECWIWRRRGRAQEVKTLAAETPASDRRYYPANIARPAAVARQATHEANTVINATAAKPCPASPARAASIVALRARRLVWAATSRRRLLTLLTSPIAVASRSTAQHPDAVSKEIAQSAGAAADRTREVSASVVQVSDAASNTNLVAKAVLNAGSDWQSNPAGSEGKSNTSWLESALPSGDHQAGRASENNH